MYKQVYGIIETLAPVHIGATAGAENGNLNLIFRDQFTQTGIINGSSIRGRLRADMRQYKQLLEVQKNKDDKIEIPSDLDENIWYGKKAVQGLPDGTSEALIKLEHASIVWLPVFCPGQPIVWVSCPSLLERYQRIAKISVEPPQEYRSSKYLINALKSQSNTKDLANKQILFFNLGFITIDPPQNEEEQEKQQKQFEAYLLNRKNLPAIIVNDNDMAVIHDMALYRQSRVALEEDMKKAKRGAFFNVEALPEKTILVFPIAIKPTDKEWKPINGTTQGDIYLGGLESIGFGHCSLTIKGL